MLIDRSLGFGSASSGFTVKATTVLLISGMPAGIAVAGGDADVAAVRARIQRNKEEALLRRARHRALRSAAAGETQPEVVSQAAAETQAEVLSQADAETGVVSQAQSVRNESQTCVFCHENLGDGANVQAMECMHVYHKACVQEYMSATGCSFRMACPLKCFWDEGAQRPFPIFRAATSAAGSSTITDGVDNEAVRNGTLSADVEAALEEIDGLSPNIG